VGSIYLGGYAPLQLDLASAGVTTDDLIFEVEEGVAFGSVSVAVDSTNDASRARIMLLGGGVRGEYHLKVTHRSSGETLSRNRFRITASWPDMRVGPPIAMTGKTHAVPVLEWGGAGAGAGLSNLAPPAPREWRVAVALIDLNDQRYPDAEVASIGNEWLTRLFYPESSAPRYYEEVSFFDEWGVHGSTLVHASGRVLRRCNPQLPPEVNGFVGPHCTHRENKPAVSAGHITFRDEIGFEFGSANGDRTRTLSLERAAC
jgi:hypothetical protein